MLQAYLPDSFGVLDELCTWAAARRRAGGAPVRVRIVKGANLAMEQVEAELAGWPQAPYETKADVDANYKRMLDRAFDAASCGDVSVGVASHNLFDIAWALTIRDARELRRAGRDRDAGRYGARPVTCGTECGRSTTSVLPGRCRRRFRGGDRVPVTPPRRERGGGELPPGVVHDPAGLTSVGGGEQAKFETAVVARHRVSPASRRCQDRRTEHRTFDPDGVFSNEPDTDFSLPANRTWIGHHVAQVRLAELPPPCERTDEIDVAVARGSTPAFIGRPRARPSDVPCCAGLLS